MNISPTPPAQSYSLQLQLRPGEEESRSADVISLLIAFLINAKDSEQEILIRFHFFFLFSSSFLFALFVTSGWKAKGTSVEWKGEKKQKSVHTPLFLIRGFSFGLHVPNDTTRVGSICGPITICIAVGQDKAPNE